MQKSTSQTQTTRESAGSVGKSSPVQQNSGQDGPIDTLQQSIGNRATQALVSKYWLQPKLTVGAANDAYEQEAERVADQVMRMPGQTVQSANSGPQVQRSCPNCQEELQRTHLPNITKIPAKPGIQRVCPGCEEELQRKEDHEDEDLLQRQPEDEDKDEMLQRQSGNDDDTDDLLQRQPEEEEKNELIQARERGSRTPEVSTDTSNRINAMRSGGQPLSESARAFFEPRFGQDFGHVRVHTGAQAADSARKVNALAFTVGRDIMFGAGQYATGTPGGKRLLAHELVHTVQQGHGNRNGHLQRTCSPKPIAAVVGARGACNDNFDATFVAGRLFKSNVNCDTFAPGQSAALVGFAKKEPPGATFEIHGYASIDGSVDFNKNLGCARAMAAQKKLTDAPAAGGAGIAAPKITGVVNHGPVPGPAGSRRGVVIKTTAPPPLVVTVPANIRATNTHATASDRIPPRKNILANVKIANLFPGMGTVKVSVKNSSAANGQVTVNGAASVNLAATATVNLKGTSQTTKGNARNLKLIAEHGGAVVATSAGFSVAAIITDFSVTFNSIVKDPGSRRMLVNMHHKSDSGKIADLSQVQDSEQVQYGKGTGTLAGFKGANSGYLPSNVSPRTDRHSTATFRFKSPGGKVVAEQVFIYKCARTGDVNIPVTKSGFRLTRQIFENPPASGTWDLRMSKAGTATTANGFKSAAGAGSVIKILKL